MNNFYKGLLVWGVGLSVSMVGTSAGHMVNHMVVVSSTGLMLVAAGFILMGTMFYYVGRPDNTV